MDDDILGLVRLEVEELVAGSFLEGAPIVPVSSTTGAGLDDLRRELGARRGERTAEKNPRGHFRLPIDRAFTIKGFGTVVTGTLISGSVREGAGSGSCYPAGRRLRVRGVQVHGIAVGPRGRRTAHRGESRRHRARRDRARRRAERARPLPAGDAASIAGSTCFRRRKPAQAPRAGPLPLRDGGDRGRGAAARRGTAPMRPGSVGVRAPRPSRRRAAAARRPLHHPDVLAGGDHRRRRGRGHRRAALSEGGQTPTARLDVLAGPDPAARTGAAGPRSPKFGMGLGDLVARTGLRPDEIAARAPEAAAGGRDWYVDRAWLQADARPAGARGPRVPRQESAAARHPEAGPSRRELAEAPPFLLDALLADAKELVAEGETRPLPRAQGHAQGRRGAGAGEDRARLRSGRPGRAERGGGPGEIRRGAGPRPLAAGQILLREKRLVRISDDLVFHRAADRSASRPAGRRERRSASTCRPSRNGPASRASTRSRCSNTWIASTSPAAKATSAWCCERPGV